MSRLDAFPAQWIACLDQIAQSLAQHPIPGDSIVSQIDTLVGDVAPAEDAWRGVDRVSLEAQLAELDQRREQAQSRLDKARAQGPEQIAETLKRLRHELNAMETPAALANGNKTLDKFQAGVRDLIGKRDESTHAIEQHNTRLQQIAEELDKLAEERDQLEKELQKHRTQAYTREVRQECLEQARSTDQLWQTLREPIAPKVSLADV